MHAWILNMLYTCCVRQKLINLRWLPDHRSKDLALKFTFIFNLIKLAVWLKYGLTLNMERSFYGIMLKEVLLNLQVVAFCPFTVNLMVVCDWDNLINLVNVVSDVSVISPRAPYISITFHPWPDCQCLRLMVERLFVEKPLIEWQLMVGQNVEITKFTIYTALRWREEI